MGFKEKKKDDPDKQGGQAGSKNANRARRRNLATMRTKSNVRARRIAHRQRHPKDLESLSKDKVTRFTDCL